MTNENFSNVVGTTWIKLRNMPKHQLIKKYLLEKNTGFEEEDIKFFLQYHIDELLEKIYSKYYTLRA